MNFVANQRAQRFVDQLVPRQRPFSLEFLGDNNRLKVSIVVAKYADDSIVESGLDE